jgi:selenocysteine lyase/cysteine desulfurase
VFDIAALSQRCADAGALVVVDGVQAVPHLPLTMPEHVDFAFFSAYKVFAPHFGVWYARPELRERFFRADERYLPSAPVNWSMETGTQSFEALAGWLGTVEYLRRSGDGSMRAAMERFATYERGFVAAALERFAERRDRIVLYGGPLDRDRLPVFAFNVRGERPAAVAAALEDADIEVAVGDYYTPRLMSALAHDFGSIAVRMSFAHYNTLDELDRCFAVLDRIGTPVRA